MTGEGWPRVDWADKDVQALFVWLIIRIFSSSKQYFLSQQINQRYFQPWLISQTNETSFGADWTSFCLLGLFKSFGSSKYRTNSRGFWAFSHRPHRLKIHTVPAGAPVTISNSNWGSNKDIARLHLEHIRKLLKWASPPRGNNNWHYENYDNAYCIRKSWPYSICTFTSLVQHPKQTSRFRHPSLMSEPGKLEGQGHQVKFGLPCTPYRLLVCSTSCRLLSDQTKVDSKTE